jgi:hypothetical protein
LKLARLSVMVELLRKKGGGAKLEGLRFLLIPMTSWRNP